jgi:hypothetical protein
MESRIGKRTSLWQWEGLTPVRNLLECLLLSLAGCISAKRELRPTKRGSTFAHWHCVLKGLSARKSCLARTATSVPGSPALMSRRTLTPISEAKRRRASAKKSVSGVPYQALSRILLRYHCSFRRLTRNVSADRR